MEKNALSYNSDRSELTIPEYGRNVQKLINHCKTIEDDEYRQRFADRIVYLMYQMNPQSRNVLDYKDRLWKHFFRIAEYDIKVLPPNGEVPSREAAEKKPDQLEYPETVLKFRHYGRHVQTLVAKAIKMEDGPIKDGFIKTIGSFMKMAYKNWNREHYVSDEIIINDLKVLSQGKLTVGADVSLDGLRNSAPKSRGRSSGRNNGRNNSRNNKRRPNNNNRNRRRN